MYGTIDAAQNWEEDYSGWLISIGFQQGIGSPCNFYHPIRIIKVSVHGDDFTALGTDEGLDWFRKSMGDRFLMKVRGRFGPDPGDEKEIRILNRVIQWTEEGIWYEPEPRHVEFMLKDLGLTNESKS